jgi:hypothetical protein
MGVRIAGQGLHAWVEWSAEAADVGAHLIAIALVATAGACHKQHRESHDSRGDNQPVPHGF